MSEGIILEEAPDIHEQFQVTPPALMVIFGASGDLANRKLLPAIYRLSQQRLLPPNFIILGYARSPLSDDEMRQRARTSMLGNPEVEFQNADWEAFASRLFYISGEYDDSEGFLRLSERIATLEEQWSIGGNRLFYLSTPPSVYEPIITCLGTAGLVEPAGKQSWTRVVIEKPFGSDLQSAHKLNDHVLSVFNEDQVYRIDHYLGKETVQNVLVFRFANGIFEPIWNRNYVDNVQITVAESIGVEGRGGYYEKSGALRDMMQNHLLQLVSLTAMEPPIAFDAKAVRDQKVNLLQAIRPLQPEEVPEYVVRAQYGAGTAATRPVPAYLDENGVASDSTTETYVAWRLEIDNWRWQGVPFYLRTGKALPRKASEISVTFRRAPHLLFDSAEGFDNPDSQYDAGVRSSAHGLRLNGDSLSRNVLTMRIQPDEGITLKTLAKRPGPSVNLTPVNLEFTYGHSFGEPPDAYQRLLLDVVLGDSTLFTRRDEVELAWQRITQVLDGWRMQEELTANGKEPFRLPHYPAGTWGPTEADSLLEKEGQHWVTE
ncbi:MAG: glucose-6-phosphate dehydrogenase [Caldilineaceae bacterium]|uniref:Glucose-6-phosphate 1-dehydrogenase n=1 Tax=Caldilineaceae bacterium SB0675_bin_29 TaxID=2605266 RepID=A0A6B1G9P1_9CHLR|nr:glucose-6-phosphate dehydrogenase [Caldilineaceae bacterium]MYH63875.1 glucose-6-phosphate dehydrogenase [Caldilineaceae bacterium SB0675_bin_29]